MLNIMLKKINSEEIHPNCTFVYWQVNSTNKQVVTMISSLFCVKALPVGGRACTHH